MSMQQDVQHVVMGAIQDVSHTTSVTTASSPLSFYSFLPPSFPLSPLACSLHPPSLTPSLPHSLPLSQLMNYEAPSMVTGEDYKELEEEVLHTVTSHTLTHVHPHTHILTHTHLLTQHKRNLAELQAMRVEKEQLLQRVHDLETQLKASEEEVEDITMEVELLKSKLKEAQSTTGSVAPTRLHVHVISRHCPYFSY